jgi:hypothetical protein
MKAPLHSPHDSAELRRRIVSERSALLSAAYEWIHRVGLSCLRPRPRHRKNQPQVMEQWVIDAPLLSRK